MGAARAVRVAAGPLATVGRVAAAARALLVVGRVVAAGRETPGRVTLPRRDRPTVPPGTRRILPGDEATPRDIERRALLRLLRAALRLCVGRMYDG